MRTNLAICIPFGDSAKNPRPVRPEWALSLAVMTPPMNCSHMFLTIREKPRDEARNFLVEEALKAGVTYIMFIDDDTAGPFNTLHKLMYELDQDPELGAIGGIYCTKTYPPTPTVIVEEGGGPFWHWKLNEVFPCIRIGTGLVMIRASVFETIPKPWFKDINSISEAQELGMVEADRLGDMPIKFSMTDDVYFFRKFEAAGFKLKAHGGVMGVHWNLDGTAFMLPDDSYPVRAFLKDRDEKAAKQAEAESAVKQTW